MAAGKYNITIDQGADFVLTFQLLQSVGGLPVNLGGCTLAAKLRPTATDPNVLATFTPTITDSANGKAQIALTAVTTAALAVDDALLAQRKPTAVAWDLYITYPDTSIERLLEGVAYISPAVTR